MPREQRTATRKTAVNTTPLGQFKSGIVQSVQYQAVAPEKSSGQKLAEGVGLVAKVATKLTTDYATQENKERTLMESIRQEGLGRQYAGNELSRIREEASQLPKKQRRPFLEQEFNKVNQGLQKNEALDSTYYGTVIRKLSGSLETLATSWDTEILAGQQQENVRLLGGTLSDDFNEGVDMHALLEKGYNSGRFKSRSDSSIFVFSQVASIIEQRIDADKDGTYNVAEDVKKYLSIKSADGIVDFEKTPKYKVIIDKLEAKQVAHTTSLIKKQKDYSAEVGNEVMVEAMQLVLGEGAGADETQLAEQLLEDNRKHLTAKQRGALVKQFRSLTQTGFQEVSDADTFLDARASASNGDLSSVDILKLSTSLTKEDVVKVQTLALAYTKNKTSAQGSTYINNVSRIRSTTKAVLNKTDALGNLLDPKGGPNRVRVFQDDFTMAIEEYLETNDVQVVPYSVLKTLRDDAEKSALKAHPEVGSAPVVSKESDTSQYPLNEDGVPTFLARLFGGDEAIVPKNNPKSTPITEEEFATLGKEIIMQIANDKTADSSHIEMAQKIIKSKGW